MTLIQPSMKILKPLRTLEGFLKAFDNGGHFWSIWSDSGDGVITTAEIAKVGPSLLAGRTAILYFELLRGLLPAAAANEALASLDREALARWKKHKPRRCSPAEALSRPPGTAVIVESKPIRAYDAAGDGISFMKLVMVGTSAVPIAVPIVLHFRLWRLDDGKKARRSTLTLLAVQPKRLDLSDRRFAIGALVHESRAAPRAGESRRRCLIAVAACPV